MARSNFILLFLAALFTFGCQGSGNQSSESSSSTQTDPEPASAPQTITVKLEPKSGSNLSGTAIFTEANGEVMLKATVRGISEGVHAIHLHEKGDCSSDDGTSAGGHWNPTNEPHGEWGSADGYHKGDIGNFEVNSDGIGEVEFSTDEWCIGCKDPQKDILGKAVIVHEGADDFTTQPTGDAGGREGCGGIIQ